MRQARSLRILFGGLAATTVLGSFFAVAVATSSGPDETAPANLTELSLVVRTPAHLERKEYVAPLVERFAARGVERVWVQVKQDENDEFAAGTAFYPSRVAPVAPGYEDGRLGTFVDELAESGIEPLAWMPVLHDEQAARAHPAWRSYWIAPDGSVERQEGWLCPFNPAVARYQAALAREVVTRYPRLSGLYLDFIRYDDDYSCASPRALAELEARTNFRERVGRPLRPLDIRRAGRSGNWLWTAWTELRAEQIAATIETIETAVAAVRPDLPLGAFVLPFSSEEYERNTEAGQDLPRMARAGLDDIVLMGYWDDWDRTPEWVSESLDAADRLVDGAADVSVVLDGDMGVRRTRLTLEALGDRASRAGWFNYWFWSEKEFRRLGRAIAGHQDEGRMPKPEYVSVVVRIDTEPDYQPSYDAVRPQMIHRLLRLFREEDVPATFVTVGKLAQLQPGAVRAAAAAGHEIASHSYDHEQLDALAVEDQIRAVDGGLAALERLRFDVRGFGAPRNSITDETRDRLMDWNLEYDGSASYDPLRTLLDVHYAQQSEGADERIVVLPFIVPNDYDARFMWRLSPAEMLTAWKQRLDRVVERGEPVFVLDVHQWLVSKPGELRALREFIRYAKQCETCRVETLRDAARHARSVLDRYELPAPTSGDAADRRDRGALPRRSAVFP